MSKLKVFIFLFLSVVLAYGASLQYGFSQDDWFHLTISQAHSVKEFLNFFNPFGVPWIFFRPLSTQLPYWLSTTMFSLPVAPYFLHTLMLFIHVLNAYLVFQISQKYLKRNTAILLSIFYAISNVHFLSLFYIGAIQQLISTCFSLFAIKYFVHRDRPNQLVLAALTLCALLSKELALRLPLILLVLSYFESKNIIRSFRAVSGPILAAILYVLMRFLVHTAVSAEYFLSFSPATTLATAMWYGLFSLGFPELILQYGQSHGLVNFLQFFRDDPILRLPIIFSAITFILLAISSMRKKSSLIFPALSLVALLPVIFLPTHRYPHYLDLSLIFMGIWLLKPIGTINFKVIFLSALVSVSMLASIAVDRATHWTTKRSLLAQDEMQTLLATDACNNPGGIRFEGSPRDVLDLSYALSLANGPRVICANPQLQVYYQGITP